jgi:hypothetical protein
MRASYSALGRPSQRTSVRLGRGSLTGSARECEGRQPSPYDRVSWGARAIWGPEGNDRVSTTGPTYVGTGHPARRRLSASGGRWDRRRTAPGLCSCGERDRRRASPGVPQPLHESLARECRPPYRGRRKGLPDAPPHQAGHSPQTCLRDTATCSTSSTQPSATTFLVPFRRREPARSHSKSGKPLQRDLPEREPEARNRVHARGIPGHEIPA